MSPFSCIPCSACKIDSVRMFCIVVIEKETKVIDQPGVEVQSKTGKFIHDIYYENVAWIASSLTRSRPHPSEN